MPQRVTRKGKAAVSLLIAGSAVDEIAEALDYTSTEACRRDIERTLADSATDLDRAQTRSLMAARYETMLKSVWTKAIKDNDPEQLSYQRQAVTLVDRLVALHGAAAPTEVVVTSPTTKQLMEFVSSVTRANMPDVIEADVVDMPQLEPVRETP